MFVLDTDHLGIFQRQTEPEFTRLLRRLSDFEPTDFWVTIVSFHEQVNGWNAYLSRARNLSGVVRAYRMFQDILADFASLQVLPFDGAAAEVFASLRSQRIRVSTMDLRIGSVTIARGYRLLTRNVSDFARIPGLVSEDWTRGEKGDKGRKGGEKGDKSN